MRISQRGFSYVGFLALIAILGFMLKVVTAVGPAYYDNYTIDKIIISLFRDGRANSVTDFKRGLADRFQINNIRDKTPDDFEYEFEDKRLTVNVDYEVRQPFMGNVDVIMTFKKTYGSELKAEY